MTKIPNNELLEAMAQKIVYGELDSVAVTAALRDESDRELADIFTYDWEDPAAFFHIPYRYFEVQKIAGNLLLARKIDEVYGEDR